jgi:hypothetical protein
MMRFSLLNLIQAHLSHLARKVTIQLGHNNGALMNKFGIIAQIVSTKLTVV